MIGSIKIVLNLNLYLSINLNLHLKNLYLALFSSKVPIALPQKKFNV
jgi:hypothetical protein